MIYQAREGRFEVREGGFGCEGRRGQDCWEEGTVDSFVCAVPACHEPCICRLASTPAFLPVPPPSIAWTLVAPL